MRFSRLKDIVKLFSLNKHVKIIVYLVKSVFSIPVIDPVIVPRIGFHLENTTRHATSLSRDRHCQHLDYIDQFGEYIDQFT
ncbi:MAG: hypothetical protein ABF820_07805 [Sporolactobacillus sp.]